MQIIIMLLCSTKAGLMDGSYEHRPEVMAYATSLKMFAAIAKGCQPHLAILCPASTIGDVSISRNRGAEQAQHLCR